MSIHRRHEWVIDRLTKAIFTTIVVTIDISLERHILRLTLDRIFSKLDPYESRDRVWNGRSLNRIVLGLLKLKDPDCPNYDHPCSLREQVGPGTPIRSRLGCQSAPRDQNDLGRGEEDLGDMLFPKPSNLRSTHKC